jgi:murein DD-endopeptidase MepM/ murein hydrolase activator NlpD
MSNHPAWREFLSHLIRHPDPHRYVTFLVIPHHGGKEWGFRVSYRVLRLVAAGVLALLVVGFILNLTSGFIYIKALRTPYLMQRLARLEEEQKKIAKLQAELAQIKEVDAKLRQMMGLNKAPALISPEAPPAGLIPASGSMESLGISTPDIQRLLALEKAKGEDRPTIWPYHGFVSEEFNGSDHMGMDISGKKGDPVVATAGGTVAFAGWDTLYGNFIIINHAGGLATAYGHNDRLLVKRGDRVKQGQLVAYLGSTGKSTAPHLHYEIREGRKAVNPRKYLPAIEKTTPIQQE